VKPGIHPNYVDCTVTCACGNTFQTRSTRPTLRTDLCSVCHPFYTGEQRIVDTAGQVERFMRRMEGAGNAGPSKRQQRLQTRAAKIEADRQREEEARAAAEAEARAARRAAAAAAAEAAGATSEEAAAAGEAAAADDDAVTDTVATAGEDLETVTEPELEPVLATTEAAPAEPEVDPTSE
jgi:large subunit ribosomal protein L31